MADSEYGSAALALRVQAIDRAPCGPDAVASSGDGTHSATQLCLSRSPLWVQFDARLSRSATKKPWPTGVHDRSHPDRALHCLSTAGNHTAWPSARRLVLRFRASWQGPRTALAVPRLQSTYPSICGFSETLPVCAT